MEITNGLAWRRVLFGVSCGEHVVGNTVNVGIRLRVFRSQIACWFFSLRHVFRVWINYILSRLTESDCRPSHYQ